MFNIRPGLVLDLKLSKISLYLIVLFLLFFSSFLFADQTITTFSPTAGDISIGMLSMIFGQVADVLSGESNSITSQMFKIFNEGMMSLGGIIVGYTLMVGTLRSASDGQFLGQKWDSMMTPIRCIGGFSLLIPQATGYCTMQIFVIWVAVQGVGVADSIWDTVLDYAKNGGQIVNLTSTLAISRTNHGSRLLPRYYTDTLTTAANYLAGDLCMSLSYNAMINYAPAYVSKPTFYAGEVSTSTADNYIYDMPGPNTEVASGTDGVTYNYDGICGQYSYSLKFSNVTLDLLTNIDILANNAYQYILTYGAATLGDFFKTQQGVLMGYVESYYTSIKNVIRANEGGDSLDKKMNDQIKLAKLNGWMTAGSYYYVLVKANQNDPIINNNNSNFKMTDLLTCATSASLKQCNAFNAFYNNADGASSGGVSGKDQINQAIVAVSQYKNNETSSYSDAQLHSLNSTNTLSVGTKLALLLGLMPSVGIIMPMMLLAEDGFSNVIYTMANPNNKTDPLAGISAAGAEIIDKCEIGYIISTILVMVQGFVEGLCAAEVSLWVSTMAALTIGGATTGMLLMMITFLAATLAYYVPMIPFMIFVFTAIGWVTFIIESMAAAPLVALGISSPEGHDVMGKAEPAIMLIASVFVRPALIIIGFVISIIFCRYVMWLFNYSYYLLLINDFPNSTDYIGIVWFVARLLIYVSCVTTLVNTSFSIIYLVPGKVMRWLGLNDDVSEAARAEQMISSGMSKNMETAAGLYQKASGEGKGVEKLGQNIGKLKKMADDSQKVGQE